MRGHLCGCTGPQLHQNLELASFVLDVEDADVGSPRRVDGDARVDVGPFLIRCDWPNSIDDRGGKTA